MRIIRITTNYKSYLKQFYNRHNELKSKDYITQNTTLMSDCYGWANFWTLNLDELGYEVWEVVGNAEYLQKKWASENSVNFDKSNWFNEIITAQIKHFNPDILFVNDYSRFSFDFINHLKNICPNIKLVLGWCGAPYRNSKVFYSYDLILSNLPEHIDEFKRLGLNSEYMPHGFESSVLDNLKLDKEKNYSFTFTGSIVENKGFHNKRKKLLYDLLNETNLEIWTNFNTKNNAISTKLIALYNNCNNLSFWKLASIFGSKISNKIKNMQMNESLTRNSYQAVYGNEMYQVLRDSKITLNNHIDITENASNMRLFEATGVGTCLITDWKKNISEFFEPDYEVVTYKTVDELLSKIKYLHNNENERIKIAEAGQKRTLKNHNFKNRAMILDEFIRKHLNS